MKIVPVVSVRTVMQAEAPARVRHEAARRPGSTCFSSQSAMPVAWMKERSTVP